MNSVIPWLQVINVLYEKSIGDAAIVFGQEKNPNQMNQSHLFSSILKRYCRGGWHAILLGREGGLPHRLCHLTVAVIAFRRHRIDDCDTGPLEEVVKYVGREMLIEGDPGEKPWHKESQWV